MQISQRVNNDRVYSKWCNSVEGTVVELREGWINPSGRGGKWHRVTVGLAVSLSAWLKCAQLLMCREKIHTCATSRTHIPHTHRAACLSGVAEGACVGYTYDTICSYWESIHQFFGLSFHLLLRKGFTHLFHLKNAHTYTHTHTRARANTNTCPRPLRFSARANGIFCVSCYWTHTVMLSPTLYDYH